MKNRPQILICDDEPLMTASIKAVLGTGNYRVQTTNSPRHALTLIHAESPDLVILDVMMPEMTGFELLDAIDREHCDAAFIIVTGEASVDSAIKAIRKGASDYLRKPFEPDELIIRVENVLKQRQMKHDHMCVEAEKRQLENQLRQSPEDGSHRHPGRRHRPRFQQRVEHYFRQCGTGPGRHVQRTCRPPEPGTDPHGQSTGPGNDSATAQFQPQGRIRPQATSSEQRHHRVAQADACLPAHQHLHRARYLCNRMHHHRRCHPDSPDHAQPVHQCRPCHGTRRRRTDHPSGSRDAG